MDLNSLLNKNLTLEHRRSKILFFEFFKNFTEIILQFFFICCIESRSKGEKQENETRKKTLEGAKLMVGRCKMKIKRFSTTEKIPKTNTSQNVFRIQKEVQQDFEKHNK